MGGEAMGMLRSRKVQIALVDAFGGICTLAVQTFWPESQVGLFFLGVWGLMQPVVYAIIKGIATEDAAAYAAGVHPNQVSMDELRAVITELALGEGDEI